ncbi:MAG: tRNA pseudouridine(38-40) synthase TruA [Deltaproteobacteria bacterium]|nr:tRNA pseudouridine(38-40) synthase TruA [Deltaproteobacteria bacterium]MCB9788085.1 tRNA pseudouridine(38-40) synthase TruA [Deltaproteobacteria bacterium]
MTSRTLLLYVQYDGTDFAGWQMQAEHRTVQGELTRAVESMVAHRVVLHGASRTDSGVHARALPVCFDTDRDIPLHGFRRGLNARLADDLAIVDAVEAEPGFRTRSAAVAKTYRYLFQVGEARRPLWTRYAAWVKRDRLDLDAMADAASRYLGDHDFSAFRSSQCDSRTRVRRMYAATITPIEDAPLVAFDITGNAFLRNMVRIMAGTVLDVGRGRLTPDHVSELLRHGDRTQAGPTAPAQGLTLMRVHFEGYPRLGRSAG